MNKKTFYVLLALGLVVTIGIVNSAFTNVNTTTETSTETIIETETPFSGTWVAGTINADGTIKDAGTGNWTVAKGQPGYFIKVPTNIRVLVASPMLNYLEPRDNRVKAFPTYWGEDNENIMYEIVVTKDFTKVNDFGFSFIGYGQ